MDESCLPNTRGRIADLATQIEQMQHRELPAGWDKNLPTFPADAKGMATRESSGKVLNALAQNIPWLIGGAADLATSNKTDLKFEGAGTFEAGNYGGRNFHFGVREHGMAAALNGMAVSGVRPFGGTFFNFSDYMRPGDSPGGHDGNSGDLRLYPRFDWPGRRRPYAPAHRAIGVVARHAGIDAASPGRCERSGRGLEDGGADAARAGGAGVHPAGGSHASIARNMPAASGVAKGAYILADAPDGKPEVILMGTGSEVSLCVSAYEQLKAEGIKARVVSMPSWDIFEQQSEEYKESTSAGCESARRGGNGFDIRMVAICGPEWHGDRDAPLRGFRAAEGFAEEVWVYNGKRSRGARQAMGK